MHVCDFAVAHGVEFFRSGGHLPSEKVPIVQAVIDIVLAETLCLSSDLLRETSGQIFGVVELVAAGNVDIVDDGPENLLMSWFLQLHPHHEVFDDFLQLVYQMPLLDEIVALVFVGQGGKLRNSTDQ